MSKANYGSIPSNLTISAGQTIQRNKDDTGWDVTTVPDITPQQGEQGVTGLRGRDGLQGDTGVQGQTGIRGNQGDTGFQGVTGAQGEQGNTGIQGITGTQGIQGQTGINGTMGLQGVTGPGTIGPQGITGIQGQTGLASPNTQAYSLMLHSASQSTTTDSQTMYWGGFPVAPSTTAGRWRVYIPKTGTITSAYIYSYAGTVGSNENWSMYIRYDNTSDTLIQTLGTNVNNRIWSNTSLSIGVEQGHYIEIKEIQPAWGTNPATVTRTGVIYIAVP
jgi:hypothetical protein